MPRVTRRIFYLLVGLFLASTVIASLSPAAFDRLFILTPYQAVMQFNIWQFVTNVFAHASLGHLFGNALALFFFGGLIEQQLGGRRYLWFLILAGVAGGIAHTAVAFATGLSQIGLLGFSGSVFAILTAAVIWFPKMRVLVMFLFPVPLRVLAAIFGFFLIISIWEDIRMGSPLGSGSSGLAHLAGVLMGVLMVKVPGFLDFFEDMRIPILMRRRPKRVRRVSMGHPGRHTDPDDLYDDPHWKLDQ